MYPRIHRCNIRNRVFLSFEFWWITQTKMPCIGTRKAFLTGLGFIVEEFQEFFEKKFKDYFRTCFLCEEPEMMRIMQYVEDLETEVEMGAEFLPVFAPPGLPGVRKFCLSCSIRPFVQIGCNSFKQVNLFKCQKVDWGLSICLVVV